MQEAVTYLSIGLGLGAVYGIIGLSFTAIYNVTGILNFAQGEFAMIGAVVASLMRYQAGWSLMGSLVFAVLVASLAAVVMQLGLVEPLIKRGTTVLQMTVGTIAAGLLIQGAVTLVAGTTPLRTARYVSTTPFEWAGVVLAKEYVVIIAVTVVLGLAYWALLNKTRLGLAMQAVGQNGAAATSLGIRAQTIRSAAFVMSACIAAVAGFLVAPLVTASVFMGLTILVNGFIASVVGGLGKPLSPLVGGLVLGLVVSLVSRYVAANLVQVSLICVLLVILIFRPHGLLGKPGVDRA